MQGRGARGSCGAILLSYRVSCLVTLVYKDRVIKGLTTGPLGRVTETRRDSAVSCRRVRRVAVSPSAAC
jgi:hypothetical protein